LVLRGEEVAGGWRRLHNEEFHKFYSLPAIIRLIKSRMKLVGHVVSMEDVRDTVFWLEDLKGRNNLEDLGIDRKITLEWILDK
jgi:hypothetical protein